VVVRGGGVVVVVCVALVLGRAVVPGRGAVEEGLEEGFEAGEGGGDDGDVDLDCCPVGGVVVRVWL
jgi:hypothetical protein